VGSRDDTIKAAEWFVLVVDLEIDWVIPDLVYTFRSYNSASNAIARILGISKIWQMAIDHDPAYVLEVISERFDKLSEHQRMKLFYMS